MAETLVTKKMTPAQQKCSHPEHLLVYEGYDPLWIEGAIIKEYWRCSACDFLKTVVSPDIQRQI